MATLHRVISVALGHDGGRPICPINLFVAVTIAAVSAVTAIAITLAMEPPL